MVPLRTISPRCI